MRNLYYISIILQINILNTIIMMQSMLIKLVTSQLIIMHAWRYQLLMLGSIIQINLILLMQMTSEQILIRLEKVMV